jgi:hypothetical protein
LASYLTGASKVVTIFVHTARALTITKRCECRDVHHAAL